MSARVFNPVALNELPRATRALIVEGNLVYHQHSLGASASPNKDVRKVRRALFNPNAEETRRFLRDEFAKMAACERNRWNFDFVAGCPLSDSSGAAFEWTPVGEGGAATPPPPPGKRAPAPQTTPAVRARGEDSENLYPPIESSASSEVSLVAEHVEQMTVDSPPTTPSTVGKQTGPARSPTISAPQKSSDTKTQSHITDFMKIRKRIEERPMKKLDSKGSSSSATSSRPSKMPRLSMLS